MFSFVDGYTQNNFISFSVICNHRSPRMSTAEEKVLGLTTTMTLLFSVNTRVQDD